MAGIAGKKQALVQYNEESPNDHFNLVFPQKDQFCLLPHFTQCQKVKKKRHNLRAKYLTVILRGRAGYELIYITNEAVGRVGYYQLISGKSEKNNCFGKFSSNSLDFFG